MYHFCSNWLAVLLNVSTVIHSRSFVHYNRFRRGGFLLSSLRKFYHGRPHIIERIGHSFLSSVGEEGRRGFMSNVSDALLSDKRTVSRRKAKEAASLLQKRKIRQNSASRPCVMMLQPRDVTAEYFHGAFPPRVRCFISRTRRRAAQIYGNLGCVLDKSVAWDERSSCVAKHSADLIRFSLAPGVARTVEMYVLASELYASQ